MNIPLRQKLFIISIFTFAITFVILFSFSLITVHAQESPVSAVFFTQKLKIGMKGVEVIKLQEFLKQFPDIYPDGLIDGSFGLLTKNAVKLFQKKVSIVIDGVVGPITRGKLNELLIDRATDPFTTDNAGVNPGLPTRLKIPNLSTDAVVEYVGLTTLGAMDVPQGLDNVAWFNLGSQPGEVGSAVISGHSGYKDNKPAVFDDLYKLAEGDKVYIEDDKGAIVTFVVREIKSYDRNANAADVFSSNDGLAHLNLITCTGDWNAIAKTHSDRLVVFTDRVY